MQKLAESLCCLSSTELLQLPQAYLLRQEPIKCISGKDVINQGRSREEDPSGRQERNPSAPHDDIDQDLLLLLTGSGKATRHMGGPANARV